VLFSDAMPVWITILVIVFLIALVKVTPRNDEANGVPW
jgi:hypothetical protein